MDRWQATIASAHTDKRPLLEDWTAIQNLISQQSQSDAFGAWHPTVSQMHAQQPTIFVFTSGEVGDGSRVTVPLACCEHFAAKGFAPYVILGLNLAENYALRTALQPWTTKTNRAHLSWLLCFLPTLYEAIHSFGSDDSFFLCEDSARLLDFVELSHVQRAGSDKWLAYRWMAKQTKKRHVLDAQMNITNVPINGFHNAIGSKLFCLTKQTIHKLWKLLTKTDI